MTRVWAEGLAKLRDIERDPSILTGASLGTFAGQLADHLERLAISPKQLAEIAAIPDHAIDTSDIPEQGEEFFQGAKLVSPEILTVLKEATDAWKDEFEAGARGEDCEINGGDLLEWFSEWREKAIAALETAADDTLSAIKRVADAAGQDPYEKAARAAGWTREGDNAGIIYHKDHYESWKAAVTWAPNDGPIYENWRECCEEEEIEI